MDLCESGVARLDGEVQGSGGQHWVTIGGCSYGFYAQYVCTSAAVPLLNIASADGACGTLRCAVGQYVLDHACKACPAGRHSVGGDLPSGPNTQCYSGGSAPRTRLRAPTAPRSPRVGCVTRAHRCRCRGRIPHRPPFAPQPSTLWCSAGATRLPSTPERLMQ